MPTSGLAHDGDADRCLAIDATGEVVDGDAIMVILALAMQEAGELADNTLVATVMSNLGLHLAMRAAGVTVRTTSVGDRYVLEELRSGEYSLGGEQSGHIVLPALATTGDGMVTGLRLMSRMAQTGSSLAALASAMQTLPQVLINVEVADKATAAAAPSVRAAVRQAEDELGDTGRILLRPSGTEQMIRVMVEARRRSTSLTGWPPMSPRRCAPSTERGTRWNGVAASKPVWDNEMPFVDATGRRGAHGREPVRRRRTAHRRRDERPTSAGWPSMGPPRGGHTSGTATRPASPESADRRACAMVAGNGGDRRRAAGQRRPLRRGRPVCRRADRLTMATGSTWPRGWPRAGPPCSTPRPTCRPAMRSGISIPT